MPETASASRCCATEQTAELHYWKDTIWAVPFHPETTGQSGRENVVWYKKVVPHKQINQYGIDQQAIFLHTVYLQQIGSSLHRLLAYPPEQIPHQLFRAFSQVWHTQQIGSYPVAIKFEKGLSVIRNPKFIVSIRYLRISLYVKKNATNNPNRQ